MSYCETPGPDYDSWVSTINWNRLVDAHNRGPLPSSRHASSAASATPAARRATADQSTLTVDAIIGPGSQTRIVSVSPGTAPATRSAAGSPYHFTVRNGAGDVVSDTAVASSPAHVDPGSAGEPASAFLSVSGTVPAAGVLAVGAGPGASISLEQGSTVLAKQTAPAHDPDVHIVSPRRGQRVRGRGVVRVGWTVIDPDPVTLSTSIDYSSGPSRPWHTIEVGTNRHVFSLPARFFTRATQARVRVRVNDGFHETAAVSAAFRAAGNPPAVTITGPRSGLRVRADATVSLTGQAFDETGHLLTGRRLSWFVGSQTGGDGVAVATAGLAPGRRRITLRARDSQGRIGSTSIVIHVISVAPQFLTLKAPGKLGRHAHRVVLRLASSVPAAVLIAGGSHARKAVAGRAVTRVAVTVRPGRSPVRLRVTLRAGGRHVTAPVTVPRQ
jgi:hypothetical protein